jgi:hypothetical protein
MQPRRRARYHCCRPHQCGVKRRTRREVYGILAPMAAKGKMLAGSQFICVRHDAGAPICQDFPHSPAG